MTSRFDTSISLAGLFSGEHRKPTLILLVTPFLLTVFKYFGSKSFYLESVASFVPLAADPELGGALYAFAASFLLLGIVPLLIIRFVFREPLSVYGVKAGDGAFGWRAVLVLAPIFLLSTFPSSRMPDFLAEYPLNAHAGSSPGMFAAHVGAYAFYYLGWEFFFRGFLQFGLRSTLGDWNAILVMVLASCLVHIGKPVGETLTSILGGLIWGILAFRTRSLLYGFITHWILGVSLDFFIVYF
jgi:membrane protease YdiL (CAAX protease family)